MGPVIGARRTRHAHLDVAPDANAPERHAVKRCQSTTRREGHPGGRIEDSARLVDEANQGMIVSQGGPHE